MRHRMNNTDIEKTDYRQENQGSHSCLSKQWWSVLCYAKSLQSCPTLCDPRDGSPPGSPVPGILQARTLEWVAISFSNAWKWKVKLLSHVWLLATPWTAAHQAPLSMGLSRQEYWSRVPLPSPSGGRGEGKTDKRKVWESQCWGKLGPMECWVT